MYYPDVPALDPEDIELLCNEYIAHNKHLDPHIADRLGVKRGLRNPDGTGVLAGITNVSSARRHHPPHFGPPGLPRH